MSPMFKRRHYEALASVIFRADGYCETTNQRSGVQRVRNELIALLIRDNPNFNRALFEAACRRRDGNQ